MEVIHPRVIAFAVALAVAAAPTTSLFAKPNAADDAAKAEARERLEKGRKLYNDGAFEAALVEFQRAYELAPSYKILYNIGLIEQQLNDFVASLRAYERYLKEGGKDVAAGRRAEVEKSIAAVKQSIATLNVKVSVDGADVSIDDVLVGKSPLADGVLVNAGKRRIVASKDGRDAVAMVNVAGGDTKSVTLDVPTDTPGPTVVAPPAPTTTTTPSTPPDETPTSSSKPHPIPWIGVGVTGALAAGAIVTGILALKSSSTLKSDRDTLGTPRSTLDDDQSKVKRWSIANDVLTVGAIVAGGITAYFWLKKPSDEEVKSGGAAVKMGVAPNGVLLAGEF